MKIKTLLFLFICLSLSACKDDDDPSGNGDRPDTQAWIEDTMREHYYWYNEIPAAGKLNYANDPETFFKSLLSDKDGKDYQTSDGETRHRHFSIIKERTGGNTRSTIHEEYSYGFEFSGIYKSNTSKEILALVLYIVEGSPADEAGLQRGDWITKINDVPVTDANYASLTGGEACSLTIEKWDQEKKKPVEQKEKINLPAARQVEDKPVHTWNIIYSPVKNKKVGYLLYNHFTAGRSDNDTSYDDLLKSLSGSYFNGVDEFVLDLRYNNGGALSSGILLCTILQPENQVGSKLGYLQYNDKQKNKKVQFNTNKSLLGSNGKNLNLKTLYVLVSSSSASASEMVINSLEPFMDVVVIGETTVGKNVGSLEYTSDDKKWEMHPIVCQIYNSEDFTDYADGITPDVEADERGEIVKPNSLRIAEIFPLGDSNERLLKAAIDLIDGKTTLTRSIDEPGTVTYKKVLGNSIDRKATGSVIINK